MAKARELRDIELQEISFVDKAANKKKFLFFKARGEGQGTGGSAQGDGGAKYCVCSKCGYSEKRESKGKPCTKMKCPECGTTMQGSDTKVLKKKKKINIVIDSDGTFGGTKIKVNGDVLEKLRDFSFSFYGNDKSYPVSCSYSKSVETEDGFSRSETFYLSKGKITMDKKIQEQIQEYHGEDEKIDFEKAEENEVIVKAITTVNEYREDFPDDLKKAIGAIAMQAGLYSPLEKKEGKDDKADIEKAGAKFSKDILKKLQDMFSALKSILPELAEDGKKAEKSEDTDVEKAIEEVTKKIEEIEKKNESDVKDKLNETLDKLNKRLKTVEEGTGVKKSIEGQDDGGDGTAVKDDFPSIHV